MKDEFITNILAKMMGTLTQEQCTELKNSIVHGIAGIRVRKTCTELMDVDQSYIHYLQLFSLHARKQKANRTRQ